MSSGRTSKALKEPGGHARPIEPAQPVGAKLRRTLAAIAAAEVYAVAQARAQVGSLRRRGYVLVDEAQGTARISEAGSALLARGGVTLSEPV